MKKSLALILLIVITSGCTSTGSPDTRPQQEQVDAPEDSSHQLSPEDQPSFSQLASKSEASEYHVGYEYDGPGPLMYIGEPEVFSYGGVRMVARPGNMPGGGMVSYNAYYSNGVEIGCSEGSEEFSGCNSMPVDVAPSTDHYSDRIERFNVTKKGPETHLGRGCYLYRLQRGDFINSYMDICLDSEKGFVSFLDMKAEETGRKVMDMEATDYEAEASRADITPPKKAVPQIQCYSGDLNITTTDYSGKVKFSVNSGENRTLNMDSWSVKSVSASDEMKEGENEVKAYAGGTEETSSCRR